MWAKTAWVRYWAIWLSGLLIAVGGSWAVLAVRPEPVHTKAQPASAPVRGGVTTFAGDPIDWDTFPGGIEVPEEADAEDLVAFDVSVPQLPGATLSKIMVSNPSDFARERREVCLFYDSAESGRVLLIQHGTRHPPRFVRDLLSAMGDSESRSIMVVGDKEVLQITGMGLGRLIWISDGVHFDLLGPSLTPSAARSLASRV